jgi:uncharacterized protein YaiE (UPF0345 family)
MADQSDVENTLAALVAGALYPHGGDAASISGLLTRVYRGWPVAAALDSDLAGGRVNVTVFPLPGARNTTRYMDEWLIPAPVEPALTVTVAENSVTFSGSVDTGQLAGILADGKTYVYQTAAGDTPALVAANLAAAMRADWIVLQSGSTITVPGAAMLLARIVAEQPALMQTRRQEQLFRITCWCPDPLSRDATASAIDAALAQARFIALPDGSQARLLFRNSEVTDRAEDASLYRRDLVYSVEYPTTLAALLPTMLFADIALGTAGQVTAHLIG